jgi:uncharacterized membrane protein YphA (DoxX/SURF4 family)
VQYTLLACRAVIGVVFLVSALSKVRAPADFTGSVRALVPPAGRFAPALAVAAVVAEFAVAAAMVPGPAARWGMAGAALLLLAFSVALALAITRGVTTPCRCFGSSAQPPGGPQLVRNAALILVSLLGVAGSSTGVVHPAGAAVAFGAAAVLALLAVGADDLALLFETTPSGSQP